MNHQYSQPIQTERHLKLWIYFLPVVGILPAIKTLYHTQKDHQVDSQQQKASRLAISLIVIWLSSYSLLFLGAANTEGIMSFRLMYTNALLTTGYFITCTYLMFRLGKKSLPSVD
ncbi:MAG: hypothetical protein ACRC2S_01730 [Waterburya sp.]